MNNLSSPMHPAEEFARFFSHLYLEKRDFEAVKSFFDENISWYGTGSHEICRNISDANQLLDAELATWDGFFKVTNESYTTYDIEPSLTLVAIEIDVIEDGLNIVLLEMHGRISLLVRRVGDSYKVLHVHFSVPNIAQTNNEFIHKSLVADYDKLLEDKLVERTDLLKQKTKELEILTNNICGGVQICREDDVYSLVYVSDGYSKLTGYSSEELNINHNNSHLAIVHPLDREPLVNELNSQLNKCAQFTLEYRIIHKDGHSIWVLDNGTRIIKNGLNCLQCILTDISVQKEQENLLRISEKRYETAMLMSDMVMFEYNIITRQLILFERDAKLFNLNSVIDDGMETFISRGIIPPESEAEFREMYRQIHAGADVASCCVHAKDAIGNIHEYELTLHTVFDADGVPQRAVGVRKNVGHMRMLQREQEFGKALVLGKNFMYEANASENTIVHMSDSYLDALDTDIDVPYTQLMDTICEKFVAPEWRATVLNRTSLEHICRKYENGERLIIFNYKRKSGIGSYLWYEATISIMCDEHTGNLHLRFYNSDINDRVEKESRAVEERRIYETMTSRAKLAYEVNVSGNCAIKGHEKWGETYGIEKSDNYSEMITAFSQRGVYAEDGPVFAATFAREHLLDEYSKGNLHISCQYRKPNENGELRWVCCTIHMYEDPETDDIKGYSYVEDIDEQKCKELELKYNAEHDAMTGLLNKTTTETIINSFLENEVLTGRKHAMLMVDIDFFKNVNDTFGHLFGDTVLREVAQKIKHIFRDDDIVGRIGGDEFIILMKNSSTQEIIEQKASEICRQLMLSYDNQDHVTAISASVGVAMFPHHGTNYAQLNQYADTALYHAKRIGKNNYKL